MKWISRLLYDPTSTLKSGPPSKLKILDLYQCALTENGAETLCECLNMEGSNISSLISLDVRENDVKSWNRPLAEAAVKSTSLIEFCGISFTELYRNVNKAYDGTKNVSLVVGKDAMCHGTLALLLSLRPFMFPDTSSQKNPLAHKAPIDTEWTVPPVGVRASGSISLDLRGSAMCGFYWEEVEALDELIVLLQACVGVVDNSIDKSVQLDKAAAAEKTSPVSPLIISSVELDDDCGLTDKQIQSIYDACLPPAPSTVKDKVTTIKMNGAEYKPSWGCSIM